MTRDEAFSALSAQLRIRFGAFVVLGDVRRQRHLERDTWLGALSIPTPDGDIALGEMEMDERFEVLRIPSSLDVVNAIRQRRGEPSGEATWENLSAGQGGLAPSPDSDETPSFGEPALEAFSVARTPDEVMARARQGENPSWLAARQMLPKFLADPETRASALLHMADVETALRNPALALGYLDAAAREYANRFDLGQIEACVVRAKALQGPEAFEGSAIAQLSAKCEEKMAPVARLLDVPAFRALWAEDQRVLVDAATLRSLQAQEVLLKEGEPARNVFVVKKGLLSVFVDTHGTKPRLIRCCYPGWLLGETSVLGGPGARVTATLKAQRESEVWVLPAKVLAVMMERNPAFRMRVAATKHLHRLDAFFSLHEILGQLDVFVRDDLLACLHSIQVVDQDTVLLTPQAPPAFGYLVGRGVVEVFDGQEMPPSSLGKEARAPTQRLGADQFLGIRDLLHQVVSGRTAIARPGSMLVVFDGERLRAMAEKSPPYVVASLERLG